MNPSKDATWLTSDIPLDPPLEHGPIKIMDDHVTHGEHHCTKVGTASAGGPLTDEDPNSHPMLPPYGKVRGKSYKTDSTG